MLYIQGQVYVPLSSWRAGEEYYGMRMVLMFTLCSVGENCGHVYKRQKIYFVVTTGDTDRTLAVHVDLFEYIFVIKSPVLQHGLLTFFSIA